MKQMGTGTFSGDTPEEAEALATSWCSMNGEGWRVIDRYSTGMLWWKHYYVYCERSVPITDPAELVTELRKAAKKEAQELLSLTYKMAPDVDDKYRSVNGQFMDAAADALEARITNNTKEQILVAEKEQLQLYANDLKRQLHEIGTPVAEFISLAKSQNYQVAGKTISQFVKRFKEALL